MVVEQKELYMSYDSFTLTWRQLSSRDINARHFYTRDIFNRNLFRLIFSKMYFVGDNWQRARNDLVLNC